MTAAHLEFQKTFATEIAEIPDDQREVALDSLAMVAGWPAWDELRSSGRTVEQATAAMSPRHHRAAQVAPHLMPPAAGAGRAAHPHRGR